MTINWAILGAGRIASKFAEDFKAVPNGKLLAVASRSKAKALEFSHLHDIPKSYDSYEAMLQDEEINVVYIATPHNFHFEQVKLCLNHGKSVLCEKPVTVNSSEFEILIQLAKEKKLFFMEAMWTYYLPAIQQCVKWVQSGKIGDIKQLQVSFGFIGDMDSKLRLADLNLAGGALLDIGIYGVAISQLIFNKPIKKIQSLAHFSDTGIDDYNNIQIQYEGGGIAQIASSFLSNLKNEAVIYGTKGNIVIPEFWMAKKGILISKSEKLEFLDDSPQFGYHYETIAINELLKKGALESSVVPLEKSRNNLLILDEIRNQIGLKYPFEK
ncbi:Gfo/Idh/MocA family protein [Ancylomarina longa]|uniref:Gfo/Idh/MocA family oxidoreductase n=1 Tax=Ancylomarina longa TaxID=2487017 RepID=A0A434AX29_9BACT|nr:Gfo/Idh/MocA family oxidoreductase [Ancylomarina longa]RUT79081.1 gfo/Idh/MocA family oxidoreductase [Ancylomarina longa]